MILVNNKALGKSLDDFLQCARFNDYCPNGLQVEGKSEIRKIVSGVTASLELIERAIAAGADAIVVHHGYFWRNQDPTITRTHHARIAALIKADLNLFAYHLPLDAHDEVGNNVQLSKKLGLSIQSKHGEHELVLMGHHPVLNTLGSLAQQVQHITQREPLVIGKTDKPLKRIAWCTGAAQSMFADAIDAGADVFITGEVSEPTFHLAQESGVAFIAAGHHATERYGVQALGQWIAHKHGVKHEFIDVVNPV